MRVESCTGGQIAEPPAPQVEIRHMATDNGASYYKVFHNGHEDGELWFTRLSGPIANVRFHKYGQIADYQTNVDTSRPDWLTKAHHEVATLLRFAAYPKAEVLWYTQPFKEER